MTVGISFDILSGDSSIVICVSGFGAVVSDRPDFQRVLEKRLIINLLISLLLNHSAGHAGAAAAKFRRHIGIVITAGVNH